MQDGRFGWMPTENQELLLKSALMDGDEAINSWTKWQKGNDIEMLDGASLRLLPIVLYNLTENGLKRPEFYGFYEKMKSISVKTWFKNNLILNEISEILKIFSLAGIETVILKGIPVAINYYPKLSLRPMGDFDILVPWEKSETAGNILLSEGWVFKTSPIYPVFRDSFKVTKNSFGFRRSGLECDLHWSIFKHTSYPGSDSLLWNRSRKIEIRGENSLTLSPEDQLVHILEHGARWGVPATVRWVCDASLLLRSEEKIDWDYIDSLIGKKYLSPMINGMFEYLSEVFNLPIPKEFILKIKAIPASSFGRKLYEYSKVPRSEFSWRVKNYFEQLLFFRIYSADFIKKEDGFIILSFFRFLLFRWEVKSRKYFPFIFVKRVFLKFSRFLRRKLVR